MKIKTIICFKIDIAGLIYFLSKKVRVSAQNPSELGPQYAQQVLSKPFTLLVHISAYFKNACISLIADNSYYNANLSQAWSSITFDLHTHSEIDKFSFSLPS